MMRFAFTIAAAMALAAPLAAQDAGSLAGKRVLFVGDSITQAGGYIGFTTYYLEKLHPERDFDFLGLGLASETLSGLSEDGHAGGMFPRPCLFERLGRVLEKTKPEVVFACYGMNDGIYLPLEEGRFAKFQDGMRRLHEAVTARGAKIVHLTPAIFDPTPPEPRAMSYDAVLTRYSEWLIEQRQSGWAVVDLHGPMGAAVDAQRKINPAFTFAKDHVHADEAGHAVMAEALLAGLNADRLPEFNRLLASEWMNSPAGREYAAMIRKSGRITIGAWLSATGHLRPGVAQGLPLAEAQAQTTELERQIRATQIPR